MTDFNNLNTFLQFIEENNGIADKLRLATKAKKQFALTQDRKVFYCADFAVRFSSSKYNRPTFANTVLSLSNLQKFDDRPFIVCLATPEKNYCFIANTTFLQKISHSSEELAEDNIKGSFNGSDIMREFDGISNEPKNIERLFAIHEAIGFDENLSRLVATTQNITPTKYIFIVGDVEKENIIASPARALSFQKSTDYADLKKELDEKVAKFQNEILCAAFIENVNIRGNIIEYLIAGEDEKLRNEIIKSLKSKTKKLPKFKNEHTLGDYQRIFENFHTETDVKTKIMFLNSNPKAYNVDKILEFLAREKTVFMFYFVGIDKNKNIRTVLVSMFEQRLLDGTRVIHHWAGRDSRGVTQLEGHSINSIIESQESPTLQISLPEARAFLEKLITLTATTPQSPSDGTVSSRVAALAREHGVTYVPTRLDQWAMRVNALSGNSGEPDDTIKLILALERSNVLSHKEAVDFILKHIAEK